MSVPSDIHIKVLTCPFMLRYTRWPRPSGYALHNLICRPLRILDLEWFNHNVVAILRGILGNSLFQSFYGVRLIVFDTNGDGVEDELEESFAAVEIGTGLFEANIPEAFHCQTMGISMAIQFQR